MSWTLADIILGIVLIVIIGRAFYIINDTKNKGIHSCSKSCSTCLHPCHPMGNKKTDNDRENP